MKAKGRGMTVRGREAMNARYLLMYLSHSRVSDFQCEMLTIHKDGREEMNVNSEIYSAARSVAEPQRNTDAHHDLWCYEGIAREMKTSCFETLKMSLTAARPDASKSFTHPPQGGTDDPMAPGHE
jgi:hypothetical protein